MPLLRRVALATCVFGAAVMFMPSLERADAAGKGATVVRAVDGDTLRVRVGSRVRVVHLTGVRAHSARSCKGRLARARLAKILRPGRRVVIRTAGKRFPRSRAFRAEVYLPRRAGVRSINRGMLTSGHLRVRAHSRLRSQYHRAYVAAQLVARQRKRGIWGSRCSSGTGSAPSPAPSNGGSPSAPGTPTAPDSSGPALPTGVGLELAATGFTSPIYVTGRPGASGLIVVEQKGKIRIAREGAALATPLLDLSAIVHQAGDERGLLGLAFHPAHAANGLFYVNYVDTTGWTRVVEYQVAPGSDVANPASARELLALQQPGTNHNGGHLAFGADGMLYISLGDGGPSPATSQDLSTLLGTILRIDVNGTQAGLQYRIPADNPFVATAGARGEIWAYGLRNPWRFSVDRSTGALWIGDVGQNQREEIDFIAAGAGGANFGWNAFEGDRVNGGTLVGGPHVGPVAEYTHDDGCSVTGGYVYRGALVPGLSGKYVYTDYCSGKFWTFRADLTAPPVEITDELGTTINFVASFGEDNAGELYLVAAGKVYRFVAK